MKTLQFHWLKNLLSDCSLHFKPSFYFVTILMSKHLWTFSSKPTRLFQNYKPVLTCLRSFTTQPPKPPNNVDANADNNQRKMWSDQDNDKLQKLVEEHGNNWALFTNYFPGRTANSLYQRYLHVKHNYQTLTLEEKAIVKMLLGDTKESGNIDWEQVQQSLPQKKPVSVIQKYYRYSVDPSINRGKWTEKETQQLLDLVKQHGQDWPLISKKMGTRTGNQISLKYAYLTKKKPPPKQKSNLDKFSEEEDKALIDAVRNYSTRSFERIKKELNSKRSAKQLKYRYYTLLDPTIDKSTTKQAFGIYDVLKSVKLVKDGNKGLKDLYNHIHRWDQEKDLQK